MAKSAQVFFHYNPTAKDEYQYVALSYVEKRFLKITLIMLIYSRICANHLRKWIKKINAFKSD